MDPDFSSPIRFIAIDDDLLDLLAISELTRDFPFLQNCGTYTNVLEAYEASKYIIPDVVFLDIEMPQINGLDLFRKLRSIVPIAVFITSHPEFALEGFELSALDYILKPLTEERLAVAVRRIREFREMMNKARAYEVLFEQDILTFKDGYTHIKLAQRDIVYLEAMQDYTRIVTVEKSYMTLSSLSYFMDMLPSDRFIRVHRSYGVAIRHIKEFKQSEVLCNNTVIPVGKTYRPVISKLKTDQ
ncbi:LytR/AlgR family response regulator transcription factor [Dyadobacter jiangsuensis]|uniref:LytTR family two component transcriptional regulator n=1 Tax=Dyadobacter jiangsuensis TaxID=1591085 RepID=A0A2P8GC84_9BACT|nr:LytTR family DNA-binding domain-containing protein [Dyadobacter jiangsuensis]PSL31583.1 LytTR family two component transcriptional regulator [Dyadobacter jiangsuensis]